ncbi:hypothetical protein FO488_10540 [Geobacter sp. FeAm09]|uniref:P-loop ATPase, Sll1717 family n=1 Tax=Geobacter sp. FeAm09 TaxID=2597769 RepID=UPI0011EEE7BB|nr:hypothetical protein [Geobacter sp. FeAm09]QEM68565.1 hypothetical protein FO488_10540 [Geobacter sp. FeAm09]
MEGLKLSDIYLGVNDGKKEARYKADFEKYFFDYNNLHEHVLDPAVFLILGRKGSGKTILAEYIKKTCSGPTFFIDIRSYKDFRFHELVHLKSGDISPNEYFAIWEWVMLLDLAKIIIQDEGIPQSNEKRRLDTFFKENYASLTIDVKKVIEITKQHKIKGSLLKQEAEYGGASKQTEGSYLQYLEDLREVVITLLSTSRSEYALFYDELDDRFRNEEYYKNSIISLLKAADKINMLCIDNGCKCKIYALLRSDIFSILNDPDLNKIVKVNGLTIDWGNKVDKSSPLFELILTKASRSVSSLESRSYDDKFKILFPQDIKRVEPERFILERTLFRPRDIVTYLNLIIKKYPTTSYFGFKGFLDLRKSYSEYLLNEIRNEMCGHISDDQIDTGLQLLKQFNRHNFKYTDIKLYWDKNKDKYKAVELDNILSIFFKFNIVGNKWFKDDHKKNFYSWAHRDPRSELDFDKEIIIHLGLRDELSV